MKASEVIQFWFEEISSAQQFKKDKKFDKQIWERFSGVHRQATAGELFHWRESPEGRLAEVIVLDQFSRNLFRDQPESFAYDRMALVLSQEAIRCGASQELAPGRRAFLYMPFMHSESLVIHDEAIKLFSEDGLENMLKYEVRHKAIIDQFGRYPHRNEILGRKSTPAEIAFLQEPGSSF